MKVFCSWCQSSMGEKEPLDNKTTSHGMCPSCEVKQLKKELEALERDAARYRHLRRTGIIMGDAPVEYATGDEADKWVDECMAAEVEMAKACATCGKPRGQHFNGMVRGKYRDRYLCDFSAYGHRRGARHFEEVVR